MTTELTPFAEIQAPPGAGGGGSPDPALGRLVVVAQWFAARRDVPGVLTRPRLVLVTGHHGLDPDAADRADAATTELLADAHGVGVVRVDSVDQPADSTDQPAASADQPADGADRTADRPFGSADGEGGSADRAGGGVVAGHSDGVTADVLSHDAAVAAVESGRRLADREIDAGADLLVPGLAGTGHPGPLGVLTAVLTGLEPVAAVAVPDTVPTPWVRAVIAVRDTLFRLRDRDKDVLSLIAAVGGTDLGMLTGLVAQAAVRRTPVLLDGLPATIAAVLAHRLAPGAEAWFLAAGESPERPGRRLQDMLGLPMVAALETNSPTGGGAVLVLPLVQAALRAAAIPAAAVLHPAADRGEDPAADRAEHPAADRGEESGADPDQGWIPGAASSPPAGEPSPS